MKLVDSNLIGVTAKTILAGLLTLSLVACPPAPDLTPDSFVIAPVTGAALGVEIPSATLTVSGITAPVPISVIGGKYQIDSAAFTSTSGTVNSGQTVKVSVLSSNLFGTTKTATLTVGGITAPFSVTTLAADTTPDAFSFPAVNNAALSTVTVSSSITVAGLNTSAPIQVTGGEYSIDSTTNFVSGAGTVQNGQVVRVRATSSNAFNTPVNATLTIGGVNGTFAITTRQADTTPDAFSFAPISDAALNTLIFSAPVTITGIESSATVTISGGSYSINSGSFTNSNGTITNGQTIQVQLLSSSGFLTASNTTLTVGGVSATLTVTTRAKDTTPDGFSFPNLTNVPANTETASASVVLTGFDDAPISIVGGSYKINNGAFTSQSGTVQNGDTLTLSILSSSVPLTNKDLLVTVGGVPVGWDVRTNNLLTVLPNATLPLTIPDGLGAFPNRNFGSPRIVNFTVPDMFPLKLDKIKVRVRINHSFRTDLQILIFAPNGSSNQLFDTSTNTTNASNVDVTFDADAPASNNFVTSCISAGSTCTGSIQPLGAFSNLNILNQDPKGQWRIEVRDAVTGDIGTIQELSLQLVMKF